MKFFASKSWKAFSNNTSEGNFMYKKQGEDNGR